MGEPLTGLDSLRGLLRYKPLALLSDVDGTISPLAATPWQARITPRARDLLARLSTHIVVGLISGRDLGDLQRMVGLPDLVYVGLHGLAWRIAGADELVPEAAAYRRFTLEAAAELAHLKRIDGLVLEVKTVGVAIHYRNVRRPAAARFEIVRAVASSPAAGKFELHDAIRVVELRPPVGVTKGVAVERLTRRFGLRALLYLGDDLTDVDAFEAVRRLREAHSLAAYGLAVVHAEAAPAVAAAADFTLTGVEGVEQFLAELVESVEPRPPAATDLLEPRH